MPKKTAKPRPPVTADEVIDMIKLVVMEPVGSLQLWVERLADDVHRLQVAEHARREGKPTPEEELARITAERDLLADCVHDAWTLVANASGGDWLREGKDWERAARRFHAHAGMAIAHRVAFEKAKDARGMEPPAAPVPS